ncbi:MAG: zf-TFIIB domain-containing protein [Deltaproteobacteria bacterium]|nr:zf-TFIIB domain-containing protein [Deltaproteobacteria bacterium]
MDEKDRLGSKLREKERAEEDRYFAERDRELIAKLKQGQEAEEEKMVRELARNRCPKCGERLGQRVIHGVVIEECGSCQGMWLDKGELQAVSKGGGEGWIGKFLEGLKHLLERPGR